MIRPAEINDIDTITFIEAAVFPVPWNAPDLSPLIADDKNICSVAVIDNNVIGYILCKCAAGEMEVYRIAVHEKKRRLGIGIELVEYAIQKAAENGVGTVYLEVSLLNIAAIGLYEKAGFGQSYIRKNYYSDSGGDALVMKMEL